MNLIECDLCDVTAKGYEYRTAMPKEWLGFNVKIHKKEMEAQLNFHICLECVIEKGLQKLMDNPYAMVRNERQETIEDFINLIAEMVKDELES